MVHVRTNERMCVLRRYVRYVSKIGLGRSWCLQLQFLTTNCRRREVLESNWWVERIIWPGEVNISLLYMHKLKNHFDKSFIIDV